MGYTVTYTAPQAAAKNDGSAQLVERARQVITELEVKTAMLVKNDISQWRAAHQQALNVENPKRINLYNIYDFTVEIDTHTSGVVERTKLGVMQSRFKLVTKEGKECPEVTAIFESPWFWQLMGLALDAEYYGNSVIQLGNVVMQDGKRYFDGVRLVPRANVCPEYGVILRNQADEPGVGIPYRSGPFALWTVEAGEPADLGRYLKVAPHVISKKHVQIFWDNFAERFGIPIIYATTETRNDSDRAKVENMLSNFGNNTWGFFPAGVKLDLLETAKGDTFKVFDERIVRANKEISIGLAGQTMSFEDGSSRAQGEVHERGFEEVKAAFATRLKFLINFQLLPKMLLHGFPLQGYSFEWDNSTEYTPEQMRDIEQMLLDNYEINPQYFIDKYNIDITGVRQREPDPFGAGEA
ncbi:MAG: DUF935 domain-containing protein [Prevotellaceae bacterium]|jgi:hypothetical protein|nr:DUF935 domain-containing protein [Prevotellaceae bacterium]